MGMSIGPLHVRRSVLILAPAERVWQEFETSERLKRWLNLGHTLHKIEPRVGGEVEMSVEIDGEQHYYGGAVLICEPHREPGRGSTSWPATPSRGRVVTTPSQNRTQRSVQAAFLAPISTSSPPTSSTCISTILTSTGSSSMATSYSPSISHSVSLPITSRLRI